MEKPQRFFTRVALKRCGIRDFNYGARLMKFGIDTLELRRVKQDLITWFKLCSGFYDISVEQMYPPVTYSPYKIFQRSVPVASSSWYANRTVPIWNSLPAAIDFIATANSFKEFLGAFNGDKYSAWNEYLTYGGMPLILNQQTEEQKSKYLKDLFELTYKKDIVERNNISKDDIFDSLIDMLASSVGSLTNPQKLYNAYISNGIKNISKNTLYSYIDYLLDSFLIEKAQRYDIKGKTYITTPQKYYFADIGLRNARLNFRQIEENHLMENIIYNELLKRGFNVDVGVVEIRNNNENKQLEIDFVCNLGNKRYYIQSVLELSTRDKTVQEERPFMNIHDNFKKILIVKGDFKPWYTEEGILVLSLFDFLLNENSLEF